MRRVAMMVVAGAMAAGCSTSDLAKLEDPIVIAGIAMGSRQGCCEAAKRKPTDAAIALRVLNGLTPQLEACRAGLEACMPADPNAIE